LEKALLQTQGMMTEKLNLELKTTVTIFVAAQDKIPGCNRGYYTRGKRADVTTSGS